MSQPTRPMGVQLNAASLEGTTPIPRRRFLEALGVLAASSSLLTIGGCSDKPSKPSKGKASEAPISPGLSCGDASGLPTQKQKMRALLKYVDSAPGAKKRCSGCSQFVAGKPGACGTCKIVPGPINPAGSCASFTARPA